MVSYSYFLNQVRLRLTELDIIQENTQLGIFVGYQAALLESIVSLSQIFRLRKRILLVGGASSLQGYIQYLCASLNLDLKLVSWVRPNEIRSTISDWDPGLVLCPREQMLTSEPIVDLVRAFMENKRMGLISWSHLSGFDKNTKLHPYEVQFLPLANCFVIGHSGSRFEFSPQITDFSALLFSDEGLRFLDGSNYLFERIYCHVGELNKLIQEQLKSVRAQVFPFSVRDLVASQVLLRVDYGSLSLLKTQFPKGNEVTPCAMGLRSHELNWLQPALEECREDQSYFLVRIN